MKSKNEKENLSLEETFNQIGWGRFQILVVIFCGILQSFDAMELLILVFLGQILSCDWKIGIFEESFLTTSVFIGAMGGGIVLGILSDKCGRKTILVMSSLFLIYSSMLSAFVPTIEWLMGLRLLIGVSLGGIMVSLSALASELMPTKDRGTALLIILGFWPIGSYFLTTLSMLIVPYYGWRVFLLVSIIPLMCSVPLFIWIPESPRYLLLNNRKSDSLTILNRISKFNKSKLIRDIKNESVDRERVPFCQSILNFAHSNYLSTTILTNILWATSGISYYSIILLIPVVKNIPRNCLQTLKSISGDYNSSISDNDNSCCTELNWKTYKDLYISTTGELLFLVISVCMMKVLPRKVIMAFLSSITGIGFILLNLCLTDFNTTFLLFSIRGAIFSMFNLNYIYTSEVFPTSIRSLAMGICHFSARIGSILSTYVVYMLIAKYSFIFGTFLLGGLNILSFFFVLLLPYETRNRKLYQTTDINENSDIG